MAKEKYKKLDIDYELPWELNDTVNRYVDDLNHKNDTLIDCYQEEIRVILNWCQRDDILPIKEIEKLRNYYQRGGILKNGQTV